ncbi:DNA polymerase III subunit chi [Candidatus Liberibacter solanacearum CLso-ZC1]|uniref:DNA polymerase III subunit chi n=1 Tax=Liberibacter solanacearum (strain CLso-ZC1) TaxID=658172 RepID=E4UCV8_LIBSC|nr:DNA polymerase III subunit chi [Candidatus Liberibacter solanacearum]ADR52198.1 DNA polymerase III subunit chi [Candidatus Liberibacter solanacearum CLso-ZC1]
MTDFLFCRFKHNWQNDFLILLESEYQNGLRISIQCGSERIRDALNERLWTWKKDSFMPHGIDVGEEEALASFQPILLTVSSNNANASMVRFFVDQASMHIGDMDHYKKIIFIIDTDDQASLKWGRANWKNLKSNGYKLTFL